MTDPKPPIWPFPKNGVPTPPTPQQVAQDKREELERLGDALM